MIKRPNTNAQRMKRHKRVRAKISGTPEMPRLNVFRSGGRGQARGRACQGQGYRDRGV